MCSCVQREMQKCLRKLIKLQYYILCIIQFFLFIWLKKTCTIARCCRWTDTQRISAGRTQSILILKSSKSKIKVFLQLISLRKQNDLELVPELRLIQSRNRETRLCPASYSKAGLHRPSTFLGELNTNMDRATLPNGPSTVLQLHYRLICVVATTLILVEFLHWKEKAVCRNLIQLDRFHASSFVKKVCDQNRTQPKQT